MGDRGTDNNVGGAVERLTIREAATLLGVHYNTVQNRRKAGMYPDAEKVVTEHGETWMIPLDNLTNNAPPSARQQPVSRVPQLSEEALTILAREIVREAGLAQAQDRMAIEEQLKAHAELFKTLVLLDTALLAGAAAVGSFVASPQSVGVLVWALYVLLLSLCGGLLGVAMPALNIGRTERPLRPLRLPYRTWFTIAVWIGWFPFLLALGLLSRFVILNLP